MKMKVDKYVMVLIFLLFSCTANGDTDKAPPPAGNGGVKNKIKTSEKKIETPVGNSKLKTEVKPSTGTVQDKQNSIVHSDVTTIGTEVEILKPNITKEKEINKPNTEKNKEIKKPITTSEPEQPVNASNEDVIQKPDVEEVEKKEPEIKKLPDESPKNEQKINQTTTKSTSHSFRTLFILFMLIVGCYLCFHNRNKILGMIVEGRNGRRGRRTVGGVRYRPLDTDEAAMESGIY